MLPLVINKKVFFIICLLNLLCFGFSFTIPIPFYPFIAKEHGLDQSLIGITLSFQAISSIIISIFAEKVLRIINPRKLYILSNIGMMLFVFSFGIAKIIEGKIFFASFISINRFFQGLCTSLGTIYIYSFPSIHFNKDETQKYIALTESILTIGTFSGPLIGGVLYKFIGYSWIFYSVSIFYGIIIILISILKPAGEENEIHKENEINKENENLKENNIIVENERELIEKKEKVSLRKIFSDRYFLITFMFVAIFVLPFVLFTIPSFSLYIKSTFHVKIYLIPYIYSIQSLMALIGSFYFIIAKNKIEPILHFQIGAFMAIVGGIFIASPQYFG